MPSVRSAALGFFVHTGSRGESVAEAGLSHFLEHLLFKGTDKYASAEIDQLFDGMGAELNAGTDKESTAVYARMLDQHLPAAFDVMADMVWRPAYHDVDPEREVVLEEIAMYEDDPQDTVFDVLGEAVFGDHPLGRPIIGRAPVIRDTPIDVIAEFHRRRYLPGNIVIAAAGSVDHDQIVELATQDRRTRTTASSRCPRPRPLRATRARPCASSARTPSRCTSRSAASACSAATTGASRRACWTRSSAGCRARGFPGRPRGARPGLQRLLVRRPVRRHGPGRPVRRHAPGQPRRGDEGRRGRARPLPRGARHRGGARACARERQGARSCSAWSPPARACTGSAARCCSGSRCWRPKRSWSASTP